MPVRKLSVVADLLTVLLTGLQKGFSGRFKVENGLPADSKCVGVEHGGDRVIKILVESEEFTEDDPVDIPPPLLTAFPEEWSPHRGNVTP